LLWAPINSALKGRFACGGLIPKELTKKEIGLSKERIEGIYMSGVIHDVGKVSVPTEILSNPGRITETEFELIKNHVHQGCET